MGGEQAEYLEAMGGGGGRGEHQEASCGRSQHAERGGLPSCAKQEGTLAALLDRGELALAPLAQRAGVHFTNKLCFGGGSRGRVHRVQQAM